MKIIADTATLIPPSEGNTYGLTVMPVCVAINNRTYKDYSEISSADFLQLIQQGGIPSSSQPAIGDILNAMDATEEELLILTVGDGLSGFGEAKPSPPCTVFCLLFGFWRITPLLSSSCR